MDTARRRATYDDLLRVPDTLIAEIVEGELITSPRPAFPHAWATSVIGPDLAPFNRRSGGPGGPGGWWILFEPELHLGADIPKPQGRGKSPGRAVGTRLEPRKRYRIFRKRIRRAAA